MSNWSTDQINFQMWLATPKKQREPKTQRGWAKQNDYHHVTLSAWKSEPGFMTAVENYRVKYLESRLSDLYGKMMDYALEGDHHFAKMVVEIVRDVFNKRQVEVTNTTTDETQKMSDEEISERMYDIIQGADPDNKIDKDKFLGAFTAQRVQGKA